MHFVHLLSLTALLGDLGQALKHPYLPVVDTITGHVIDPSGLLSSTNTSLSPLQRRDATHYYGFSFNQGGCGGTPQYGSYMSDNGQGLTCRNLVQDKPWDSIQLTLGSGYDVYFFPGPDCCTTGDPKTPCSIWTGPQNKTCITSAGPRSYTGTGFAKSLLVNPHNYQGSNGPASIQHCAKPGGGAFCPNCPGVKKRSTKSQNPNPTLAMCEDARNCELWFNEDIQQTSIRFKPNMGPDSDWYRENVAVNDPYSEFFQGNSLQTRSTNNASCNGPLDNLHYLPERSNKTINYGSQNPADLVAEMSDHCHDTGCDNVSWNSKEILYQSGGYNNTKGHAVKGHIHVAASGTWHSGQKQFYTDALKAYGTNSSYTKIHDVIRPAGSGGVAPIIHNFNSWKGTSYLSIVRVSPRDNAPPDLSAHANLKFTLVNDSPDICSFVKSIISGAVGEISSIGSGFFGAATQGICGG